MTNGVEHQSTFVIHIGTFRFKVHSKLTNYGFTIFNHSTLTIYVLHRTFISPSAFYINRFGISRKSLVYPHIGYVFGSDGIPEPFMTGFVYNNKIEELPYSTS